MSHAIEHSIERSIQRGLSQAGGILVAPNAPSDLVATAISATEIDLTWVDNSADETGFRVERSLDGVGDWVEVVTTAADATSYSNVGLDSETEYFYRVIAVGAALDSVASNVDSATTEAPPFSPADISGLVFWLEASARGVVANRWDDLSGNSNHFTSPGGAFPTISADEAIFNGTSQYISSPNFSSLNAAEIFIRQRREVDSNDTGTNTGWMDFSNDGQVDHFTYGNTIYSGFAKSRVAVGNPAEDLAEYHTIDISAASADWNFRLNGTTRSSSAGGYTPALGSVCTYGRSANTSYFFRGRMKRMIMYNRKLTTEERALVAEYIINGTDAVPTVPAAPTGLTANPIASWGVALAWSDNSLDETAYRVEKSADGATGWTTVATLPLNSTSYDVALLSPDTTYYHRVIAVNGIGDSLPSNVASATTGAGEFTPTDISGLNVWLNAADRGVTANRWDDKSGNNNHYSAPSAGEFPTFSNGAAIFDGNDYLIGPSLAGLTQGEAFIKVKADADPPNSGMGGIWRMGSGGGTTNTDFWTYGGGNVYMGFGRTSRILVGATPSPITNWNTINIWSKTNDWNMRVNANQYYNTVSNTVGFISTPWLGQSYHSSGGYYLQGQVRALLIFDHKLSAGERTQMDAYMANFDIPAAASGLVATAVSASQVDLAWVDNSSNETGFRIERSLDGATGWSEVTTTAANATTYSDTGLPISTEQFYRVIAVNAVGVSAPSNVDSATPEAAVNILVGLQDWWTLQEAGGNSPRVGAHAATPLLAAGATGYTTGKVQANCYSSLDSSHLYNYPAAVPWFEVGDTTVTWAFWFNMTWQSGAGIAGKTGSYTLLQCQGAPGTLQFGKWSGTRITKTGFADNTWYHAICQHDSVADMLTLYINNANPLTAAMSGGFATSGSHFGIGSDTNTTFGRLPVRVEQFGIWNRILTPIERNAIFNGGAGIAYSGL